MSRLWIDEQIEFQVWLATPKKAREPKTQKALAKILGYSSEQLSRWKRDPEWADAVNAYRRLAVSIEDYQAVIAAMIRQAKKPEGNSDRKLFLTWEGELAKSVNVDLTSGGDPVSAWMKYMVDKGDDGDGE